MISKRLINSKAQNIKNKLELYDKEMLLPQWKASDYECFSKYVHGKELPTLQFKVKTVSQEATYVQISSDKDGTYIIELISVDGNTRTIKPLGSIINISEKHLVKATKLLISNSI